MSSLTKGISQPVSLKLKNNPSFSTSPVFEVTNSNGNIIASGIAVFNGASFSWNATFIIPASYQSITGDESITVEVIGKDTSGKTISTERYYELLDAEDDFESFGVVYSTGSPVVDSFVLNKGTYLSSDCTYTVMDNMGNTVVNSSSVLSLTKTRVINKSDVPDRFTDPEFRGFKYTVELSPFSLTGPFYYFHTIKYVFNDSPQKQEILRPLYPVAGSMGNHILNLKLYLDKARLKEIDPTLQWHTDELVHALYEGANFVNGFPTTLTNWTVDAWPTALNTYLFMAAAVYALNSRYLAEGFNSFEFSGLSTNLNFDRKETITYKIEELKGLLESQLEKAKTAAIRTIGIGIPQATTTGTTNNISVIGLTINPVNNWRVMKSGANSLSRYARRF
jgi:hypothetical protein